MPQSKADLLFRDFIFARAKYCCEYCRILLDFSVQPFVLEHIYPTSKQGSDDESNLACSCGGCNSYKSNKTFAIDPLDGKKVMLFHPRQHIWSEHFTWSGDLLSIEGLTDIGRATIVSLRLNRTGLMNIRRLLVKEDKHPPQF
jgi:hypothetical protein